MALEPYDQPTFTGCPPCGGPCPVSGSLRALRARVSLPPIDGGFAPDGRYGVWVRITGGTGGLVNIDGLEPIARGEPSEVLRPIPEEDQPYAPCFDVRVTDPAGHSLAPPRLCLPVTDVKQTIRALDARAPGRGASDGGSPGPQLSSGCSLAAAPSGGSWLAALALVAAFTRARARRGSRPRTRRAP